MAEFDRRLALYMAGSAMGIVVMILAALGEFVFHWWDDLGLWLTLGGLAATLLLGILAASRFQVREIGGEVREVAKGLGELRATAHHIEQNTEAIPRIETNTSEAVGLLRDIRDRLPPR